MGRIILDIMLIIDKILLSKQIVSNATIFYEVSATSV